MIVIDPPSAHKLYRANVEQFEDAAPILLYIGEKIEPTILSGAIDPYNFPVYAQNLTPPFRLTQVVLSTIGVAAFSADHMEDIPAACFYSAGSDEWQMIAPFVRYHGEVTWVEPMLQVDRAVADTPVIVGLRELVERSNA